MTQEDKEPIDNILYTAACGIKNTKIIIEEDKQLLLKDISARLPYKVLCSITKKGVVRELKPMDNGIDIPVNQVRDITLEKTLNTDIINDFDNDNIVLKPYLRLLSSMTEEEENEYNSLNAYEKGIFPHTEEAFDWLNKNHFDYRCLIEKGLAIEVPEGMYEILV